MKKIIKGVLLGSCLVGTAWAEEKQDLNKPVNTSALMPPEKEVQYALYRLENLKLQFSSDKLFRLPTAKSQLNHALKNFQLGEEKFRKNEHQAAIAYLEQFVHVSQAADSEKYLKAHFMLGYAFEKVGEPEKARQAYLNYLAAFMTDPNHSEQDLLEVLKNLLPLTERSDEKLATLITPLSQMQLSDKNKAEILYFAGLHLAKTSRRKEAANWFKQALVLTSDPRLKAGSQYQLGVHSLDHSNLPEAEKFFSDCLQYKEESTQEFKDRAQLGLARLAVLQKQADVALKRYGSIKQDSLAHPEALFETLYIQIALKQFAPARDNARLFLKTYPKNANAFAVSAMMSYLEMKAGEWEAARKNLEASDKELKELQGWLAKKFQNKDLISYRDLTELLAETEGNLPQPSMVPDSIRLYQKLAALEDRLSLLRGDTRSMVYMLGRLKLEQLKPAALERTKQMEKYFEDALSIGQRLVAMEYLLFKDQLRQKDKTELENSQKRRIVLYSSPIQYRANEWSKFAKLADLNMRLADMSERLLIGRSQLAAMLISIEAKKDKNIGEQREVLHKTLINVAKQMNQISRAMELVREQQVQYMSEYGPQKSLQRKVRQYALSLFEESTVLTPYRNKVKNPQQRLLMEDIRKTWRQWEFVMKGLYDQLAGMDANIASQVRTTISKIESQVLRQNQLLDRLFAIHRQVAETMGINAEGLLAFYQHQINERLAKNKKWQADLNWLAYDKESSRKDEVDKKFELEQQMLQDSLRNLEQGATLPWQN